MKNIIRIDPLLKLKPEDVPNPVIIRVAKFDNDSAKDFSEQISKAHNSGQSVIPVLVDSYGGELYSLLSMISDIENSKLPVATIAVGKAMSCGSILLACGTPGLRFADANAVVMIHDAFHFGAGKTEEVKAEAAEADRISKQIYQMMAKKCGHKDKNYFLKLIHEKNHAEWYLPPAEAKKHKIINHIRVPSFTTTISLQMVLE